MTRREKRRKFSQWIAEWFTERAVTRARRSILVEPLEGRQLLAGDGFMALLGTSSYENHQNSNIANTGQLLGEGELVGEGEDAIDLVAFAKALADSGTRFFGAAWCPFCTEQKQLFQDGGKFLPFVEVTNPDRTPNQIAVDLNITEYPTWEFPDGTRLTGVQTLQTLAQRAFPSNPTIPQSSTPSMAQLGNVTVGTGSPLHIPIDAYDPNGNPLTVTVNSSNPGLIGASVLSGNRSLRLSMNGFGDMVFELFEDRAPVPAGRVIELAQDGFYDGLLFHRVINNFVIQGGDPTGTGSGGSTLGDFDDQFHLDLQHNRTGMLSFAKSSDDTNDSQFFITEGPQRFLDFNHSVFGVLTEGEAVRDAISNTATNAADRPTTNVVINTATVFNDTENSVIMLKPTGSGTGTATITVTVTDSEGNSTSQAFQATVAADTANGAPFLNPVATVQTSVNTPVNVNLTSQDAEGDTRVYSVQKVGTLDYTVTVNSSTGVATVTPPANFTGTLQFLATVGQTTATSTTSTTDSQLVTVVVTQSVPTGLDLLAESDSGTSSTDNITNAQSLTFAVTGTQAGATVQVLVGGTVVGSATATGTTTNVTVSNVSSLGQGSVLFTSRQNTNGQVSGASPGLAVVLDNQSPVVIGSGVIPTSTIVNTPLAVDLNHGEEGPGLTYSLVNAPADMTIGATTGAIAWTPTSSQLGAQALTLRLTDAAGNVTDQQISINVIEQPVARIALNAVDLAGLPITTIATGQTFKIQVVVSDLRPGDLATGIFATYVDLLFDSAIIEPISTNAISHVDPYLNDLSGSASTTGLIDELGAFSDRSSRLGSAPRVLAEVTFRAKAAGNPQLRTDSPDVAGNDILLYDQTAAVPFTRVEFGASSFVVGADFTLVADSFNFDEDTGSHSLNVLANDTVVGSAVLNIASVGTPSGGGTVTIAADGKTLNYTSATNFHGAETFTYTAQNQQGVQLTATVTVQVTDVNDPPLALNDTFTVFRNTSNNVLEVISNDTSGVDASASETLTVTAVSTGSAGGTIVVGPSGLTVRYTPASGFQGTETFSYTLSDGRGGTATGSVAVSVDVANPPPTAQSDSFTVIEDSAQASFDVLANDSTDDPSETLSISGVGTSQVGSIASVSSDGQRLQYRPGANFAGTEVITYTLRDSGGATSIGQVTFTVTGVNDAPDAVNDSVTALSSAGTSTLDLLANDINVDSGETLRITAVTQPPAGSGSLAISGNGQSVIYTSPNNTFEGSFTFTYTIDDGTGLTDTATATVQVRNFIPRDITGNLLYGQSDSASGTTLFGVDLRLVGTDLLGAAVSRTTTVGPSGSFSFSGLAPGEYMLTRESLPFLHDTGAIVPISSALTDGDAVSDLLVTGSLRAEFIDIRDFLGSNSRNSLTVAVNGDGSSKWIAARGDWTALTQLEATLNSSNSLVVTAVNAQSQNLRATLPVTGASSRVYEIGQESNMRLLRVKGSTASAGLTVVTSSAASASSSELTGEGESSGATSNGASGNASNTGVLAQVASEVAGLPSNRAESVLADNVALSPTQAIRGLLGSSVASRSSAQLMSTTAVDAAMEAVLPALRLQLADDLNDALTGEGERLLDANDRAIADL
jgi:cyclophilin family peptidyl-prolyl cis-trans isomerase